MWVRAVARSTTSGKIGRVPAGVRRTVWGPESSDLVVACRPQPIGKIRRRTSAALSGISKRCSYRATAAQRRRLGATDLKLQSHRFVSDQRPLLIVQKADGGTCPKKKKKTNKTIQSWLAEQDLGWRRGYKPTKRRIIRWSGWLRRNLGNTR